ncbi:MAG: hypothetical protein QXI11_06515 [Thermoproteota archaeon]
MSNFEFFCDYFLRDIMGIKNPDYVARMLFITNYLMPRNSLYRRRGRRSSRRHRIV